MAKVAEKLLFPQGVGNSCPQAIVVNSMLGIAGDADTTIIPNRRRIIHAQGLYWAFYIKDGFSASIYYKTSPDGQSFGPEQSIPLTGTYSTSSGSVGVWLDSSSYLSLATSLDNLGSLWGLGYRRGHLETDGTITWSAAWQMLSDLTCGSGSPGFGCNHIGLATDLTGHPFITLVTTGAHYINVVKSSTNNGIWTMAAGYPIILNSGPPYHVAPTTSLAGYYNSSELFALWNVNTGQGEPVLRGRHFTVGWGGTEDICPDSGVGIATFCAASDAAGNLYVVWGMIGGGVYLRIRYSDGTWSAPTSLSANGDNPTAFYHTVKNIVYVVYSTAGVQVARHISGTITAEFPIASLGSPGMSSMVYPDSNMGVIHNSGGTGYLNIIMLP